MMTAERRMTEAEILANDALIKQAAAMADADFGEFGHGEKYKRNWNTAYHRYMDHLKKQPLGPRSGDEKK